MKWLVKCKGPAGTSDFCREMSANTRAEAVAILAAAKIQWESLEPTGPTPPPAQSPASPVFVPSISGVLDATCTNCGSKNTSRLEMVVKQGTTRGVLSGLSYDGDGLGAFGGRSTHSSALADQCAAPDRHSTIWGVLFIAMGAITVLFAFAFYASSQTTDRRSEADTFRESAKVSAVMSIITVPLALVGVGIIREANAFNLKEHPKLVDEWRKTWVCLQCGRKFKPAADAKHEAERIAEPNARQPGVREMRTWRIDGVDRETRFETTVYVKATNAAAAKVMGELQGIVVTEIEVDGTSVSS